MLKISLILGACCLALAPYSIASADNTTPLDTAAIEAATGLKGTLNKKENVFKVSKSRTDVPTSIAAWKIPPFMGLTSWAAFTPAHDGMTMMMGDTVLFEDEVNPVMSVALDNGLDVTALHNHFFFDQPKVYFMHIGGTGDAAALAAAVKKVYGKVAEIRVAHPEPQREFEGGEIGSPNHISGAPLTDDQAVADGDFAMKENELQTVLKTMRHNGINVVAIHQHMSTEQPRILFLHYWGLGKAEKLAQSLKTVLQAQSTAAK